MVPFQNNPLMVIQGHGMVEWLTLEKTSKSPSPGIYLTLTALPLLSPWLSAALSGLGLEISFQSVLAESVAWVALHFWTKTNTSNYSFDFSVKVPSSKSKGLICICPSRWEGGEIVLICAVWGVWEQGSWVPGCPSQQLPGLLSALGSCTRAGPCLHLTPEWTEGI